MSDSHHHCDQLNTQRDDVMQELGQVKDELTLEKQLRLNVCNIYFFFTIQYNTKIQIKFI